VFTRIVVGTDGSDTAAQAVSDAIELARRSGAELDVVSAYEPTRSRHSEEELSPEDAALLHPISPGSDVDLILEKAAEEAGAAGVTARTFARHADPADAIIDVAEEEKADLIVVGNRGMTGARRFLLGSVPNKISHHAPCSVMIVRTT
jgi:nucleotide-binding universal stress UspA family protein